MPNLELNRHNLILGALLVLLIIGTPLVFLNFQSLSALFAKPQPSPSVSSKVTYQCPSSKEFCSQGKAVFKKDGFYLGFGGQLPPNSPIYAAFDGKLTVFITNLSNGEKLNTLYLNGRGLVAVYYFIGESSGEGDVKKGTKVGTSQAKIRAYDTSFIFQLIKGDPAKGEKVQLTTKDFTN